MTIQNAGVSKQIRISQFWFTGVKWQYFCFIMCNFGEDRSTNPRDYAGSFYIFGTRRQKSSYLTKYLSKFWIELYHLFSIGRHIYADYKTEISLRYLNRRCYVSWLTLGPFCRRQNWLSSQFALAFRNKMQHRFVNAQINSGTNASTSCKRLVKIGPVTSEFKRAKFAIWRSSFIWHAGFRKWIRLLQFYFSRLIGNYFCTSYEHLLILGSVIRSFRRKNLYSRRRNFYWGDFS